MACNSCSGRSTSYATVSRASNGALSSVRALNSCGNCANYSTRNLYSAYGTCNNCNNCWNGCNSCNCYNNCNHCCHRSVFYQGPCPAASCNGCSCSSNSYNYSGAYAYDPYYGWNGCCNNCCNNHCCNNNCCDNCCNNNCCNNNCCDNCSNNCCDNCNNNCNNNCCNNSCNNCCDNDCVVYEEEAGYGVFTAIEAAAIGAGNTIHLSTDNANADFFSVCNGNIVIRQPGTYYASYTIDIPSGNNVDSTFELSLDNVSIPGSQRSIENNDHSGTGNYAAQSIFHADSGTVLRLESLQDVPAPIDCPTTFTLTLFKISQTH